MTVTELMGELERYLSEDAPALSLSPAAFISTELWELERSRVFSRSWILVARADELAEPGSYTAMSVAGEPVVVVRDRDRALHGLSPVCRHRLMPVVEEGTGRVDAFACPYHLWRYRLDGELIGATKMKGNTAFNPDTCRLPQLSVQEWQGFVFLNLDADAPALAPHLRRTTEDLSNYRLRDMVQVATWVEEWNCNWKLAAQGSYESYHAMAVHADTVGQVIASRDTVDVRVDPPWVTRFLTPLRVPVPSTTVRLTHEQTTNVYNCCFFPCTNLSAFGDSIVWLSSIPQAIDRTQVRCGVLMPAESVQNKDPDALRRELKQVSTTINNEDRRTQEAVQRSTGSRFAARGHLSPQEAGLMDFYRSLARTILST